MLTRKLLCKLESATRADQITEFLSQKKLELDVPVIYRVILYISSNMNNVILIFLVTRIELKVNWMSRI